MPVGHQLEGLLTAQGDSGTVRTQPKLVLLSLARQLHSDPVFNFHKCLYQSERYVGWKRARMLRKVTLKGYSLRGASRLLGEGRSAEVFVQHPRFSYIFGLVGIKYAYLSGQCALPLLRDLRKCFSLSWCPFPLPSPGPQGWLPGSPPRMKSPSESPQLSRKQLQRTPEGLPDKSFSLYHFASIIQESWKLEVEKF